MLSDVIDLLVDPVDGTPLRAGDESWRTIVSGSGHSYDVARQGYVTLVGGAGLRYTGDDADMITAREAFLAGGHFAPFVEAVSDAVADVLDDNHVSEDDRPSVVEIGAGTGYYLARVVERCGAAFGLATDVSVPAVRRAARSHPRVGAVVADSWGVLPVLDGALDVVIDVFAPRSAGELARVLADDGRLVVLTPGPDHLDGLTEPLGLIHVDPDKTRRLSATLGSLFTEVHTRSVSWTAPLGRRDVLDLIAMGPSSRHLTQEALTARMESLPDPADVRFSATVSVLRRIGDAVRSGPNAPTGQPIR